MCKPVIEVGLNIKGEINYAYYGINENYTSLLKYYKYLKYTQYNALRKRGKKNKVKYLYQDMKLFKIPKPKYM